MTWLTLVPMALLRAHLAMMPRLDAERQLAAVEVATIAQQSGMEEGDARRWHQAMREQADGVVAGSGARPAASPEGLAAMGIGVVMAEPA